MADDSSWARLVPELSCSDLDVSLAFYRDLLGFAVRFEREGFAYLDLDGAQLMLEAQEAGWTTGQLERPYGRGINFQIDITDVEALQDRLDAAGVALFRRSADAWYRAGAVEHGQRELLVQDPDGYLLRFAQTLGERSG